LVPFIRRLARHLRTLRSWVPMGLGERISSATTRHKASRERGMTTAEYAVGTIAACAFAGLLIKVVSSASTLEMLTGVVRRAFEPFLG
jgi:hypothetical protein